MNVDVLVIGCGPAGASAAIAAHDAGASVLVVEKRRHGGGNALFAGGFLWDVRGAEAVRHVETLFFGKTGRSVAQAYVAGLNDLRSWIGKLGGEVVVVDPPPGSFPAVLPSWPHVPGSDGVRYWVVGGQPALRRGEALWHLLAENLAARGITVRHGHAATGLTVTAEDGRGDRRRPRSGPSRSPRRAASSWPAAASRPTSTSRTPSCRSRACTGSVTTATPATPSG